LTGYYFSGEKVFSGKHHEGDFTLIDTLITDNSDIISSNSDGWTVIYDPDGKKPPVEFKAEIKDLADISIFNNNDLIGFKDSSGFSVWTKSGEHYISLSGQKKAPTQLKQLPSKSWLLSEKGNGGFHFASIYSEHGEKISDIGTCVDLFDGALETEDQKIIIRAGSNIIRTYTLKGELEVELKASTSLNNDIKMLAQTEGAINDALLKSTDIYKFQHYFTPFGDNKEVAYSKENSKELVGQDPKRTDIKLWSFFYRPNRNRVRHLFSKQYRKISLIEERLDTEIEDTKESANSLRKLVKIRKKWAFSLLIISLIIAPFGLGVMLWGDVLLKEQLIDTDISSQTLGKLLLGASLLLATLSIFPCFSAAKSGAKEAETKDLQVGMIESLLGHAKSVKKKIVNYRNELKSQIPTLTNKLVYSDSEATDLISDKISGKVRKIAMSECGLEEDDLTGEDLPEYLSEWAILQAPDDEVMAMLDKDNRNAFRITRDNSFIFAIQHIQFIFPGRNKLDTFSCYYDVIRDKIYGKSAHAFFYRDVTNVSKRDTHRQHFKDIFGKALGASEITLSVASGDNITVTIRNEETVEQIREKIESHRDDAGEDRSGLQARIREIDLHDDLSEEEREEEKEALREELELLEISEDEQLTDPGLTLQLEKANKLIAHIRKQLRELKELNEA